MIRIQWQDQPLDVDRLVFRRGDDAALTPKLDALADRLRLNVADDRTDPRPGDFWLGCHPARGWGDADPAHIGWASTLVVPLAVGLLRNARPQPVPDAAVVIG